MTSPLFASLSQLFPAVLAPATVALARRQKRLAWLDGPVLVWACVVGAAVLWTVLIGVSAGEHVGAEMVRRGVLLGLLSACADTWATRKTAPQPEPVEVPEPPETVVAMPAMTPQPTPDNAGTPREVREADVREPWGPR